MGMGEGFAEDNGQGLFMSICVGAASMAPSIGMANRCSYDRRRNLGNAVLGSTGNGIKSRGK